jgi:4-amino-4-deoxychorismate lyase
MKLIETLRSENGDFDNLSLHHHRLNLSRKELFDVKDEIDLASVLQAEKPKIGFSKTGLHKCRIIYSEKIESIELLPYQLPDIQTLKPVFDNRIHYSYKYLDRSNLEYLYSQKGNCDDILIIKNDLITDSYFANLLFFNDKEWITPAKPLLKGTRRTQLLDEEKIKTADIRVQDLEHFSKVRLINAMIRFEDEINIPITNIII